jgi:hypothetical protein
MAESFLKEQLERIKKLTERMSAVEGQSERLADEMARDRASMHQDPLHEVRDFRTYSRPPERPPGHTARDSSSASSAARRRRRH